MTRSTSSRSSSASSSRSKSSSSSVSSTTSTLFSGDDLSKTAKLVKWLALAPRGDCLMKKVKYRDWNEEQQRYYTWEDCYWVMGYDEDGIGPYETLKRQDWGSVRGSSKRSSSRRSFSPPPNRVPHPPPPPPAGPQFGQHGGPMGPGPGPHGGPMRPPPGGPAPGGPAPFIQLNNPMPHDDYDDYDEEDLDEDGWPPRPPMNGPGGMGPGPSPGPRTPFGGHPPPPHVFHH